MAHEHHKADPWHIRTFDVGGDEVGGYGVCDDQGEAFPEVEEADQVEDTNGDDEYVFEARVVVWEALEDPGQGVGEQEGEDEFEFVGGGAEGVCCVGKSCIEIC